MPNDTDTGTYKVQPCGYLIRYFNFTFISVKAQESLSCITGWCKLTSGKKVMVLQSLPTQILYYQGVMDPEHQLALLCQQMSWEEFSSLATMTAATCAAMMEMVTSLEEVSIRQIPQCQQDTRYV